jgi:predicted nucleic acid-binding protein
MIVYLDSSAIVKRYIEEKGSESIDAVYTGLEKEGGMLAAFSAWNIGEVLGAIDTRKQRGDLDERSMAEAVRLFVGETKKFVSMRKLIVLPIGSKTLEESRDLIVKHHIYQADALQLATARQSASTLILTADRKLAECARLEGMQTADPEREHHRIIDALSR